MRTHASHGTGKGRSFILLPSFLCLLFGATMLPGCGDSSTGDPDAAHQGDAGPDAYVEPWTFDCLDEQPDGTLCFRGQVQDILTDAPVTLPPGSTMQWYAPSQPDGFPDTLAAEVPVQTDGRFIFREAPHEPADYPDEPLGPVSYSHASLRLITTLDGSIIPDNKYGFICPECFSAIFPESTKRAPVQTFYVIPVGAFETWDANVNEMEFRQECLNQRLLPELSYKTEIVVLEIDHYSVDTKDVHMEPVGGCNVWGLQLPSVQGLCAYILGEDRHHGPFTDPFGHFSGIWIIPVRTPPQPEGEVVYAGISDDCGIQMVYPAWAEIGNANVDSTGPVVVSHTWLMHFGPYM